MQRILIEIVAGGAIGYIWGFVSRKVTGGVCPLTCHPQRSIIIGVVAGILVALSSNK